MTATYPYTPGFKADGTSREAAAAEAGRAPTLRECVLNELRARGPLTADEAAGLLGATVLAVRPRFSELRAKGLVEDSGARRRNESGHRAVVWRLALRRQAVLFADMQEDEA